MMKWNKQKEAIGTRETKNCFAWLPVELDYPENEVVWLRWYKMDLRYGYYGWDHEPYAWIVGKKYLEVEE